MTSNSRKPYPIEITPKTILSPNARRKVASVSRYHPYIYKQRFIYTSTSAAAAMAVGRTDTLGGSGDTIYLDSTSTKDILAGSAVTTCGVWYLNGAGQTVITSANTGGTSAEQVATSVTRYCDHWAESWGGLYDAEGDITLDGSGETFGTITATANETVNTTFWISKYWRAMPLYMKIGTGAAATSSDLLDSGVITYPVYYSPGVEEDQDIKTFEIYKSETDSFHECEHPWGSPTYGNDSTASRIQIFQGIQVTDEPAMVFSFDIDWLLWCTNRASSWNIQGS